MKYDVIVIGAGHAGIEAALASARMGQKTLFLTMVMERIGYASCNPAIGGLGKGHLVKEIDALGGQMALTTDKTGIQFKALNESKGPAVRGTRAQIDMDRYALEMRTICLGTHNLDIRQEIAEELIIHHGTIEGVITQFGNHYKARAVVVTAGTFLNGLIHIGTTQIPAGRQGDFASFKLSQSLLDAGLTVGRLKTGTCPRIDARSINFHRLEMQHGDHHPHPLSFRTPKESFNPQQLPCYIAHTNTSTHDFIRSNFDRAPLFSGQIEGVGPRYCPSIEDKINRFSERDRHRIFVEPQTREANEYYLNGMSTSLPIDVQTSMVRSMEGFENAQIVRFGYAIEYDYIDPTELTHSLQTKKVKGLFLAGQINGTTGYEEAAAQGLMAGINAALYVQEKESFILRRDEAYIGVLIDDLVTKGTNEPYRMFTSRAEYRLLLREDNADIRLSEYGYRLGLLGETTLSTMLKKKRECEEGMRLLSEQIMTANHENLALLERMGEEKINDKVILKNLVGRHTFDIPKLLEVFPHAKEYTHDTQEQLLILCKYSHYIEKQSAQIAKMKKMLEVKIPEDFIYEGISGLSNENIEKLNKFRPPTLFAASEISGITPATLDILHLYIDLRKKQRV